MDLFDYADPGAIAQDAFTMDWSQFTMELGRQGAGTDKTPKGQTGEELTSMVPNIAGDADRHPKSDSPEGGDTPASHVDYLRGRYRECQLSEEASELHGERSHHDWASGLT